MTVSPAQTIVPREAPVRVLRAVPKPKPAPKLHQSHQRQVVAIQSDVIEATAELVYQRDDLKQAISDADDCALARALRALEDGDYALCREMIRVARFAIKNEDTAARRAETRRRAAQGHQQSAAGRIEVMTTGQGS
jgi:hypothetical protein